MAQLLKPGTRGTHGLTNPESAPVSHEEAITLATKAKAQESQESLERNLQTSEATPSSQMQGETIPQAQVDTTLKSKGGERLKVHPLQRQKSPSVPVESEPLPAQPLIHIVPIDSQPKKHSEASSEASALLGTRPRPKATLVIDTLKLARTLEKAGMRPDLSENITRVISANVASNQRRMAELFLNKDQIQTFSSKHQTKREKLAQQNLESHARDMDQLMQEIEDIKTDTARIRGEIKRQTIKSTVDLKLSLSTQRKGDVEEMQALERTVLETNAWIREQLNEIPMAMVRTKMDVFNFSVGVVGACVGAGLALIRVWMA
eukprot:CAMPEP_0198203072 /NCGR_PEP_ID=MMETSP1445-20131203/6320_1 /TAXON_ID=36898 /ORGANISM="Pyramimonas sp., Strain CCMP2087" /LENGTH=318 /DNA_ID=CAMNT_0043874301 /DNA_START=463 /DNA_END=1419 /DNA_ORIENTATION=-